MYNNNIEPKEGVHFLNEKFSSKSVQGLISSCSTPDIMKKQFGNMYLMALLQKKSRSSSSRTDINPSNLYQIICIQRNNNAQIYTLPDLHSSVHFSVCDEQTVREIIFRLRFLRGSDNPLPANIILSDTNFHENDCFVLNQDAVKTSGDQSRLPDLSNNSSEVFARCYKEALESCKEGLLNKLKPPSTSEKRKSPSISFGFTKSDPMEYGANRISQGGNVRSSFSHDKIADLSDIGKQHFVKLYDCGIKSCPDGHMTFDIPPAHHHRNECRRILNYFFNSNFDESDNDDTISQNKPYLSFEAMTLLIPLMVGNHRDVLNDFTQQMCRAFQINLSLPVEEVFELDSPMRKWLSSIGYTENFPFSMIAYSRIVCARDVKFYENLESFMQSEEELCGYNVQPLRHVLGKVLSDTKSHRDYFGTLEKDRNTSFSAVKDAIDEYSHKQSIQHSSFKKDELKYLEKFVKTYVSNRVFSSYKKIQKPFYKLFPNSFDDPWYDDQEKLDIGGGYDDDTDDMSDDDNSTANSMKLPDFSPEEFDRLWDLMNKELDSLDRNAFKSSLTGLTGQVGLRIKKQKDLLKWYDKKVVHGSGGRKPVIERIDPKKNWRMEVCLELRRRMGEQSLEMFFVGIVAGKEVPALLTKQKQHLMHNQDENANSFNYDYLINESNDDDPPMFDYLPSMDCTFNGPMIRVPSGWDKEVSQFRF